jgi:hypothetical protein
LSKIDFSVVLDYENLGFEYYYYLWQLSCDEEIAAQYNDNEEV